MKIINTIAIAILALITLYSCGSMDRSGVPGHDAARGRAPSKSMRPMLSDSRSQGWSSAMDSEMSLLITERDKGLDVRGFEQDREAYDHIAETPFLLSTQNPLSTFSIDVDTASYANVRRFLREGQLPPAGAVRVEEFLNYFPYNYPAPEGDQTLALHTEAFDCPWEMNHRLLRVAIQGKLRPAAERGAANLVFLVDVSGSMKSPDKLPLLVHSLSMLVQELDQRDRIAIAVYAGSSGLVLDSTAADSRESILQALERLQAGGSTNGGAGIRLAYQVARDNFADGGINRVILATDGDFNVGTTSQDELVRLIEQEARTGVFLTVLGFGTGNLQDSLMEKISGKGNGHYAYIDSKMEARKVLVEELGGTLEVIAKDVKLQVEFNPTRVAAYRLIGYENRMLAARDFADDTKDAGEVGAGHRVTALYEVIPAGRGLTVPGADPLKYQQERQLSGQAYSGEICTLKMRYKQPNGNQSQLVTQAVLDEGAGFQEASADTRFATAVAAFGMVLRDSEYRGSATLASVQRWAAESVGDDPGGYRTEFLELVQRARSLKN